LIEFIKQLVPFPLLGGIAALFKMPLAIRVMGKKVMDAKRLIVAGTLHPALKRVGTAGGRAMRVHAAARFG